MRIPLGGGDGVEMRGSSATSVSIAAGRRWGLLVSALDIAKAAVVTFVVRAVAPDDPAYLVTATFVVVGHVWPVWRPLQGGFGISPMLGGVGVVDPVALLVTLPIGAAIGLWRKDVVLTVSGWSLFLVPWFLISGADLAVLLYATTIVLIHWLRMWRLWRSIPAYRMTLALLRERRGPK